MIIKKTFCYPLYLLFKSCNELITNSISYFNKKNFLLFFDNIYFIPLLIITNIQFFHLNPLNSNINIILDTPISGQKLFQDPGTNIFEIMVVFHHEIMFYMIILFFLILWSIIRINFCCFYSYKTPWKYKKTVSWTKKKPWSHTVKSHKVNIFYDKFILKFTHCLADRPVIYKHQHTLLEIVWTILPTLFLICVAVPSLYLIYATLPGKDSYISVKVIGSQWFWTYEHNSCINFLKGVNEFDTSVKKIESHLIPDKELLLGEFRLLEVHEKLILPRGIEITFLVTATDVLHSWSVPSLGIKIDACPGRLNEINVKIYRSSIFYGQCSEICGVLHGFMPIVIETVNWSRFYNLMLDN